MQDVTIQEKVLEKNAIIFVHMLPALTRLHGLNCDVFLPLANVSNYDNDAKFTYNDTPNFSNKYVVFNYFQLGQYGNYIYDPFAFDVTKHIITPPNGKLTQNAKIKVYHGASIYEYRVNNFKAFRGKDSHILVQNLLIPLV